jgi:hypothetical protein
MSEKKMKFRELAEKRVNNTLKSIQLIGNLSNTRAYDYDEEDVKKIFKILKEEISIAESKFKSKGRNNNFKF